MPEQAPSKKGDPDLREQGWPPPLSGGRAGRPMPFLGVGRAAQCLPRSGVTQASSGTPCWRSILCVCFHPESVSHAFGIRDVQGRPRQRLRAGTSGAANQEATATDANERSAVFRRLLVERARTNKRIGARRERESRGWTQRE